MAAFASSYIKTEGSQVTRAADAASMTGANFSSWYNAAEGTLFGEVQNAVSGPDIFTVSNNTTANRFGILSNSSLQGRVTINNVSVVADAENLITGFNKIASAASVPGGLTAALNGAVSTTQALTSMPISDRAYIGAGGAGAIFNMSMHISRISYYPVRVTNAQLQALTS